MTVADRLAQGILATQSDAVLYADRDGVIRFWNPGAVRIFGFAADEAIGRPLDIIIPENLRARHNEGYARVMGGGQTRYGAGDLLSVPALTKDGRRISVEFTIIVLHNEDGTVAGIGALLRDITSRFQELRTLRHRIADLEKVAAQGSAL